MQSNIVHNDNPIRALCKNNTTCLRVTGTKIGTDRSIVVPIPGPLISMIQHLPSSVTVSLVIKHVRNAKQIRPGIAV